MPDPIKSPPLEGVAAEQRMRRLTRRSFVTGGVAALAGLGAWRWLGTATPEDGVPWPLRRLLRFNQGLVEGLGSPRGLGPTFSAETVRGAARINGLVGLADGVETAGWQVSVQHEGRAAVQSIPLRDVQALPRLDLVTELKCVEGWSEVMHFGGVAFPRFRNTLRAGDA
jgi:DMSO/TMAO reductase YedYZ molybdopterin-dependent catalytic subunit